MEKQTIWARNTDWVKVIGKGAGTALRRLPTGDYHLRVDADNWEFVSSDTKPSADTEVSMELADLYMKEKINCALWRTYAQWQDNKIKDLPCDITIELPRNPALLKVRALWQPEHPEVHATVKKVVASETTFTITYTADVKWE